MMILPATAAPAPAPPAGDVPADGGFAALLGGHLGGGVDAETAAVLDELADLAETAEVAEQVGTLVAALARSLGLRSAPTGDRPVETAAAATSDAVEGTTPDPEGTATGELAVTSSAASSVDAGRSVVPEPTTDPGEDAAPAPAAPSAPGPSGTTAPGAPLADAAGERGVEASERAPGRAVADAVAAARTAHEDGDAEAPLGPDVAAAAREAARASRAPAGPGSSGSERRVDAGRVDLAGVVESATAEPTAPHVGRATSPAASGAIARVLDAIEALESAPPPRVMVIESGEARLRVGLEAGLVRVQLLGERTEAAEQVLRETAEALDARGLAADVDGGGRDQRPDRGTGEPGERRPTEAADAPRPRAARGLQL